MKIESSGYKVIENGLVFEVKPIVSVSSNEASKEIENFFMRYKIVSAYKEINPEDKRKLDMEKPKQVGVEQKARPAKRISTKRLDYIIKNNLSKEFCKEDFIIYANKNEEFDGYTDEDKNQMWMSVYAHMLKNDKIKIVNEEDGKRIRRYRYIGVDNPEDDVNEKVEMLKNGEVVKLS